MLFYDKLKIDVVNVLMGVIMCVNNSKVIIIRYGDYVESKFIWCVVCGFDL